MGYCLSTYVVPYERLTAIPGSGDQATLADVLEESKDYIAWIDERRFDGYDASREPPIFSVAEAIKDIFTGNWRCATDGPVYSQALETLCFYLGERLPDGVFLAGPHPGWFDGMDAWLKSERVPLRFTELAFREPIPLPMPDDGPTVGHWTPEQIRTAAPAVDRLLLGRKEDDYVEALRQVREWFNKALAMPGLCLIGVYG